MARQCEALLVTEPGARGAFLTPSATQALEMAALLLDFDAGAEVIVPSFTHPSTVNAFVMRGARPVFCDIRPDTLNIDEELVGRLVGDRTAAIVCMHYAGVACEMDQLLAISDRAGVDLVEDNAHGLFATYRERPLGPLVVSARLAFTRRRTSPAVRVAPCC